jgi:hypothetical protein
MTTEQAGNGRTWIEEVSVAGDQLVKTVQSLLREAVVRKITVKDRNGRTLLEIPLYAGAAGMFFLGWWSAALLIAAWFTEVSIFIEREAEPAEAGFAEQRGEQREQPVAQTMEAEDSRCQAITKAGAQCKRTAVSGSQFCAIHQR